ncbi:hypothetical protein HK103_005314 [Boothiomyces macroporosus]|uniref:Uncharacterized protein n=1 Tax=Boothiomyces macroporosus TaxID=261099 RepID=A0AAD5ULI1_9FUNG|nr:hypothetical protein HK103_005314 [Boothiomyces macroporosus]
MWVLSLIIAVFVSYTAFRFGWKPVIAKFMTDKCIPPTYNSSRISIPASSFSQGAVNQATIYSYGIPLADGIIGGWGGWPLVTPNTDFSIKHSGIVYLLSVDCSEVYPATQAYTDTRTWTQNFKQIGNAVLGTLVIYTPQNSIILDYDQVSSQFGYMQECTVITQFFPGIVESSFHVDQFYHDSLMSQGVMGAFASVAHLLLMQYNSSVTDQCDYYGQDGTGRFRFACDFTNGGQGVFSTSSGKRRDFMANEDEINLIGDKFVKFGFDKNSLEREFDRGTAIGLKRKIVGLSHFKK